MLYQIFHWKIGPRITYIYKQLPGIYHFISTHHAQRCCTSVVLIWNSGSSPREQPECTGGDLANPYMRLRSSMGRAYPEEFEVNQAYISLPTYYPTIATKGQTPKSSDILCHWDEPAKSSHFVRTTHAYAYADSRIAVSCFVKGWEKSNLSSSQLILALFPDTSQGPIYVNYKFNWRKKALSLRAQGNHLPLHTNLHRWRKSQ